MKCFHCQGKMKRRTAPFHIDQKGYHLTLDEIPAWVCQQCGEVFFDEPEIDGIQRVIQSLDEGAKKLQEAA